MAEVTFEIVEHIGVLSIDSRQGWLRELNRVAWNGGSPKWDIREWSPDHERMTRGITLNDSEAKKFVELVVASRKDLGAKV